MAKTINSLNIGGNVGVFTTPYATCSTAGSTTAKVATLECGDNFSLEKGATVIVKFSNMNTASNPTLNVNNTGAKKIRFRGGESVPAEGSYISASTAYQFIYDGTNWCYLGGADKNTDTTYSQATSSTLGLVKIGYTASGKNYPVALSSGQMYVNVPWTDNNYYHTPSYTSGLSIAAGTGVNSLYVPQATSSTLGLVKVGYTESGKNYPVELNESGQMYVNVPWTDNNSDTKVTQTKTSNTSTSYNKWYPVLFRYYDNSNSSYPLSTNYTGSVRYSQELWNDTSSMLSANPYLGALSCKSLRFWSDDDLSYFELSSYSTYGISASTLVPSSDNYCSLGNSGRRWKSVWLTSGEVTTSSRSAKDSIHYIASAAATPMTLALEDDGASMPATGLFTEQVLDFVKNLNPVTFCYKDGQDGPATEENSEQEMIQIGLIADDIKDHPVYKYVGIDKMIQREVSPEKKDEEGNIVKEAVYEDEEVLGLQSLPLATVALTACKELLNKIEILENEIVELKNQINNA